MRDRLIFLAILIASAIATLWGAPYLVHPPISLSTVGLVVLPHSILIAQSALLAIWAGLAKMPFTRRCLVLLIAATLGPISRASGSDPIGIFVEALPFGLILVTILCAAILVMKHYGLALRRTAEPSREFPFTLRFSLTSLLILVSVCAYLMIFSSTFLAAGFFGSRGASVVVYHFWQASIRAGIYLAITWAVLWQGRAWPRIAAVLFVIALYECTKYVGRAQPPSQVMQAAFMDSIKSLLVAFGLLIVRARGYRLGWFEPSPQERIAAGRAELQALVDAHAAAKAGSPAET